MDHMMKKALKPSLLAALTVLGIACGSAQSADKAAVSESNDNNVNPIEANVPQPLMKSATHLASIVTLQDDPNMQMILHEYCQEVDANLKQCMLFDGDKQDSKLMGVEYIITEEKFNSLAEDEKALWHSHKDMVLNATVVAPGLSDDQEKDLMKDMMKSYGKMILTMQEGQEVPMGQPKLAMPLAEGQARQDILDKFSSDLGVDLNKEKEARKELAGEGGEQPVAGEEPTGGEGTGDAGTGGEGTGDAGTGGEGTGDATGGEADAMAKGGKMKASDEPTQQSQQEQPVKGEEPTKQGEEPQEPAKAKSTTADQGADQGQMATPAKSSKDTPVAKDAAPQEPAAKTKTKTQEPAAKAAPQQPMAKQGQQTLKQKTTTTKTPAETAK